MAAGPITQIVDVVTPRVFAGYIQQETETKSRLIKSGAVQRNPMLDQLLAGGGLTFDVPSWRDLDDDADRVSTDTAHDDFAGGTQSPSPAKIQTSNEIAVRLSRNQSWSAADLTAALAGSDPIRAVVGKIGNYWMRRMQDIFIATVTGLFNDNEAAPSGTEHIQNDMTFDASGASFIDGVTNMNAENVLDASLTMGDSMEDLALIMVHSIPYNRMQKNNLIDFIPDSEGRVTIPRFLGKYAVIVDDGVPNTGGVFESWLFGTGAIQMGEHMPKVPFEVERRAGAGNGGGQEIVYSRKEWVMHPTGNRYAATPPSGGPSNANTTNNLAHTGSWVRVYPQRKQIKIARLLTRES